VRRYTDVELSRILGEHAAGTLEDGGEHQWGLGGWHYPSGCANQAAFNEPYRVEAAMRFEAGANWFDNNYRNGMTPEQLLAGLEALR
jgi:hypothetical protein